MIAYYHVYAVNDWRRIVDETVGAMMDSGLYWELRELRVGIVGHADDRLNVMLRMPPKARTVAQADAGWEQVTQVPMCHAMRAHDLPQEPVLYLHTKGVWSRTDDNERWRAAMTRHLVTDWRDAVRLLDRAQVVGSHRLDDVWPYEAPHWLGHVGGRRRAEYAVWQQSEGAFPFDPDDQKWYEAPAHRSSTVFAGNWWWTTAGWLAQMPLPKLNNRFDAEHWIASTPGHRPTVVDVQPGWPKVREPA